MGKIWRFRSLRTFFGLTDEYMENVYEQFFFLKYSGGWSFSEAYNLPVGLRTWFVQRLIQQLEQENEQIEKAQMGANKSQALTPQNQPQLPPQLSGRHRQGKS